MGSRAAVNGRRGCDDVPKMTGTIMGGSMGLVSNWGSRSQTERKRDSS